MGILTKKEVLSKLSNSESFKDCVIEKLDLSNHIFNNFVDFSNAYFTGEVSFRGATFNKGANFYNVTFSKGVNFREVKTENEIDLMKADLNTSCFDLAALTSKNFKFVKTNITVLIDNKTKTEYLVVNPTKPLIKVKFRPNDE